MTKEIDLQQWDAFVDTLDVQPLFVTVSGAHLYGFPSPDSDVDLRGCHQLPLRDIVGLAMPEETYEKMGFVQVANKNVEVDIVSHDIGKYLKLLVKNNGYILEQVFSPLVVRGQEFLAELREIASRCITRFHYYHYRGFYDTQRRLIEKQADKGAKQVLYAYRVLLTGIHLLQTGEVQANLLTLNDKFQLPRIDDLISKKAKEKSTLPEDDWTFHAGQLDQLKQQLGDAFESSLLPETRDTPAVNDLLVRLRLSAD